MNAHSNDTGPHPDPNEELETPLTSQESISGRRVPRALGSRVVGMRGLALSWRGGNQPTPRTHLVEARAEGHPSKNATGMTRMSTPGELHSPGHCTHSMATNTFHLHLHLHLLRSHVLCSCCAD